MSAGAGAGLKRKLGLGLLTFYGVGVMVGAGVYVLIGEVAAAAGGLAPWAFVIAGVAAGLTAASFAELSSRIPEAGGAAAFARESFGLAWLSVLIGLAVSLVGVFSAGAVLQGGVGYLQAIWSAPREFWIVFWGLALTLIAALGAVESLAFAAVLTIAELAGLLIIAFTALTADASVVSIPAEPEPFGDAPLIGLAGAAFLAFFAYIGFEDMVNMAEETRNPAQTMPLAIALAFIAVVLIYVLVCYAALQVVGWRELAQSDKPLALVYERATQHDAWFIAAIGVAAALNGVMAQVVMAARVVFGLARRNERFMFLGRAHPRFGTPLAATLVVGAVVIVLALTAPLAALASITSLTLLVVFILMNIALIVLKRKGPPPQGALNLPAVVPYLGVAASLLVLAGAAL